MSFKPRKDLWCDWSRKRFRLGSKILSISLPPAMRDSFVSFGKFPGISSTVSSTESPVHFATKNVYWFLVDASLERNIFWWGILAYQQEPDKTCPTSCTVWANGECSVSLRIRLIQCLWCFGFNVMWSSRPPPISPNLNSKNMQWATWCTRFV